MTAAFWSSLCSAACTFSVFFTGRALLRCRNRTPIRISSITMMAAPIAMPVPRLVVSCASLTINSQRGSSPLHLPSSMHLRR
uniref:Putative secreted protein n=1 Tax=Anopheles darlingi TaxID=43151 RepID=A0A2M4D2E4_ANODA